MSRKYDPLLNWKIMGVSKLILIPGHLREKRIFSFFRQFLKAIYCPEYLFVSKSLLHSTLYIKNLSYGSILTHYKKYRPTLVHHPPTLIFQTLVGCLSVSLVSRVVGFLVFLGFSRFSSKCNLRIMWYIQCGLSHWVLKHGVKHCHLSLCWVHQHETGLSLHDREIYFL